MSFVVVVVAAAAAADVVVVVTKILCFALAYEVSYFCSGLL